jgi:hypothetical protein
LPKKQDSTSVFGALFLRQREKWRWMMEKKPHFSKRKSLFSFPLLTASSTFGAAPVVMINNDRLSTATS